ncbi:MAG: serine/threonine protein kinase, partial [Acidobacteria bacterium]|nr:serine/threonine protein kinase [Acidobacteriota bacterium]
LMSASAFLIPNLFFPNSTVTDWTNSLLGIFILFTGFAAAPIIASYALIRHRLFDIRVIIRQGLRYAAARGVLLALVPAAVMLLAADISLQSRQPLADILQKRGWGYALIAALAVTAHVMRKQWMDALDRRFFRERYNVHQIMREVAEEIRNSRRLDAAAPRSVARIESALHAEFVALMVREPGWPAYRTQVVAPAGVTVPELAGDSKLMGALRLFAKPLDTSGSQSDWLQQQLPHGETEFLRNAKIEIMVPIAFGIGSREALLALGRKKSEEPYSSEDKELLLAIASSLALLLESPTAIAAGSTGLGECPHCGSCYDSGIVACVQDGTRLSSSLVPRVLGGRYRLDRKLGRGGMGTVYSAFDSSLERQVALKLIREDLVSSAEAADRFRREAKAAAAITHPNIVTIHDFAVDTGSRAFLVMELLSGMTLRQRIQQHGRIPADSVVEITRGICSALAAAHQRGLIHRDLKPENVFVVNDEGRDMPKVLDFGLAKFVAAANETSQPTMETGAGVLLGTIQYMSPEQLNGVVVSAGWDLWALAIIIYEMLTGTYPFGNHTSVGALHHAILAAQFAPLPPELPHSKKWSEFFGRCFHSENSQRPSSAAAILAACESIIGNE